MEINMSALLKTNVLIVGSGPSGMTAALALAKFGISSMLIDCRQSNYMAPRAHALNPRTLEIFSSLGLDIEAFKAAATPVDESCWVRWVDTLNGGEYGKLPYERMHADEGLPTAWPLLNVPQPAAEIVLQKYVDSEAAIQSFRPWAWKSCEHRAEGVESIVVDDQGQEHRILSRYLIGADGAGSPVRASQGIEMKGMGIVHDFVMIHFKADLSKVVKDSPAILYWVMRQECSGTFIAYDIKGNWVFMYPYDEADTDISTFTEDYCSKLVRQAIGGVDINLEIISIGSWGLGSQVAESFRALNVFLVGDSAHRFPPSGGLGLNTGVGDAHNLAWKIAGVLQGWAWPGLLDSYQPEREHVAQLNADFSTENAGKMFYVMLAIGTIMPDKMQPSFEMLQADSSRWAEIQQAIENQRDHFDGLALQIGQHYGRKNVPDLRANHMQFTDVGARFPHTWLSINDQRASSLDLLSATRFTLIVREGVLLADINSEVPYQIKVENMDFSLSDDSLATIGLDVASLIIVRPDGHIAERMLDGLVSATVVKDALSEAVARFVEFD
jgi:2,4-dichlorophenol 6-monooxygenase